MTYITYDDYDELNDNHKKLTKPVFSIDNLEWVKLDVVEIQPKLKQHDHKIIIKNGRNTRNGKNTSLF